MSHHASRPVGADRFLQYVVSAVAILLLATVSPGQTLVFASPVTADDLQQWGAWLQLSGPQRAAFDEFVRVRGVDEGDLSEARERCREQWGRGAKSGRPMIAVLEVALQRRAALRARRARADRALFDELEPLLSDDQRLTLARVRRARDRRVSRDLLRRSAWRDPVNELWNAVDEVEHLPPSARAHLEHWDRSSTRALAEHREVVDAFFPALVRSIADSAAGAGRPETPGHEIDRLDARLQDDAARAWARIAAAAGDVSPTLRLAWLSRLVPEVGGLCSRIERAEAETIDEAWLDELIHVALAHRQPDLASMPPDLRERLALHVERDDRTGARQAMAEPVLSVSIRSWARAVGVDDASFDRVAALAPVTEREWIDELAAAADPERLPLWRASWERRARPGPAMDLGVVGGAGRLHRIDPTLVLVELNPALLRDSTVRARLSQFHEQTRRRRNEFAAARHPERQERLRRSLGRAVVAVSRDLEAALPARDRAAWREQIVLTAWPAARPPQPVRILFQEALADAANDVVRAELAEVWARYESERQRLHDGFLQEGITMLDLDPEAQTDAATAGAICDRMKRMIGELRELESSARRSAGFGE